MSIKAIRGCSYNQSIFLTHHELSEIKIDVKKKVITGVMNSYKLEQDFIDGLKPVDVVLITFSGFKVRETVIQLEIQKTELESLVENYQVVIYNLNKIPEKDRTEDQTLSSKENTIILSRHLSELEEINTNLQNYKNNNTDYFLANYDLKDLSGYLHDNLVELIEDRIKSLDGWKV